MMLKKIAIGLLFAASPVWSATMHAWPAAGNTDAIQFTLPPQEPQAFTNQFYWTITAHCKIESENLENRISVKFLRKTGQVNDIKLKSGDTIELTLQNKSSISIVSPPGSKVELTNNEDKPMHAFCSAA